MSKKRCFLILVLLFSMKNIAQQRRYTQSEIDSFEINPNTIEKQLEFKRMLQSDSELTGWVRYYRRKSRYFLGKGELDSTYYYATKGVERFNSLGIEAPIEEINLKDIYFYLSYILTNRDRNYRKSTEYLLKAIDISKKYPTSRVETNSYLYAYLASNYIKMGEKKKALQFRLQIAKDTTFMAVPREAGATYNRIGLLYFDQGKKDSAIHYYRKALKTYLESDNKAGIKGMYNNIGNYFKDQNQIDSTLYYFKKSKILHNRYPTENYGYGQLSIEVNSAFISLNNGDPKEASTILTKVLDSIYTISKIDDEVLGLHDDASDYLVEVYRNLNQKEKAIETAKQKDLFFRKYHQQVLDEKLRELNIAYEVKEKEASIEQLEAVTEEQQTIIKQRNIIAIALLGILISIIGVGILLFRQRKLKSKYETANSKTTIVTITVKSSFCI